MMNEHDEAHPTPSSAECFGAVRRQVAETFFALGTRDQEQLVELLRTLVDRLEERRPAALEEPFYVVTGAFLSGYSDSAGRVGDMALRPAVDRLLACCPELIQQRTLPELSDVVSAVLCEIPAPRLHAVIAARDPEQTR